MKRTESIEIQVEAEYEIEPAEPGYWDARAGEGLPPSDGGACLVGLALHLYEHACQASDCHTRITTADPKDKPHCWRHLAAGMVRRAYTIDLPLDCLTDKAIARMEEAAYIDAGAEPDDRCHEDDDREPSDPSDRGGW